MDRWMFYEIICNKIFKIIYSKFQAFQKIRQFHRTVHACMIILDRELMAGSPFLCQSQLSHQLQL